MKYLILNTNTFKDKICILWNILKVDKRQTLPVICQENDFLILKVISKIFCK